KMQTGSTQTVGSWLARRVGGGNVGPSPRRAQRSAQAECGAGETADWSLAAVADQCVGQLAGAGPLVGVLVQAAQGPAGEERVRVRVNGRWGGWIFLADL